VAVSTVTGFSTTVHKFFAGGKPTKKVWGHSLALGIVATKANCTETLLVLAHRMGRKLAAAGTLDVTLTILAYAEMADCTCNCLLSELRVELGVGLRNRAKNVPFFETKG
jgi:hypothetical protein